MKKSKYHLIATILICVTALQPIHGQFWKKLKKKAGEAAERVVERKVEEKAEKTTEKAFDSIFNNQNEKKIFKKKSKGSESEQEQAHALMNQITEGLTSGGEVKFENSYTFPFTVQMQITDYSGKKIKQVSMRQSYAENAMYNSQIEGSMSMPLIYDTQHETIIMLNQSHQEKSASAMSYNKLFNFANQGESNESIVSDLPIDFKKTGKTKKMNGYTCYEYHVSQDDIKMQVWFAPEVEFNYEKYMSGFSNLFAKKGTNPTALLNNGYGFAMELMAFKNKQAISKMKVTEISNTPITINLSEYNVKKGF